MYLRSELRREPLAGGRGPEGARCPSQEPLLRSRLRPRIEALRASGVPQKDMGSVRIKIAAIRSASLEIEKHWGISAAAGPKLVW